MNVVRFLFELYRIHNVPKKSRSTILKLQNKRLHKMLQYAYDHSAYYRKSFEAAGITADNLHTRPLSSFPAVSKEELLRHFDELVTADITQEELKAFDENADIEEKTYQGKYHLVHSSGSTGMPRYFVYDDSAWHQMLLGILRGALLDVSVHQFLKWYVKHPRVLYIAATDGRYGGVMAVGDGIDGLGMKQMSLDVNTPLPKWIEVVRNFNPNFIVGYPSAIKILGELVESSQADIHLERMITCGEPLNAGLRRYLERTFHTTVANFYGASESLALGVEFKEGDGMYLFDDYNVIEVVDGEMYLTCLYNFVQPLIRYHLSDRLLMREPGRNPAFSRTDVLLGREDDVLWFHKKDRTKEFIHPLSIEGFCMEGLLDYQFRKTSEESFEIAIETAQNVDLMRIVKKLKEQVSKIFADKGLSHIHFQIYKVEEIMPNPHTGKKQLVIS